MLGAPMFGAPVLGDAMLGAPMLGAPMFGAPILGGPMLGAPVIGTTRQSSTAGPFVALAAVRSMWSTGQFEQSGRMTMERTMRLEPAKWARVS